MPCGGLPRISVLLYSPMVPLIPAICRCRCALLRQLYGQSNPIQRHVAQIPRIVPADALWPRQRRRFAERLLRPMLLLLQHLFRRNRSDRRLRQLASSGRLSAFAGSSAARLWPGTLPNRRRSGPIAGRPRYPGSSGAGATAGGGSARRRCDDGKIAGRQLVDAAADDAHRWIPASAADTTTCGTFLDKRKYVARSINNSMLIDILKQDELT